MGVDPNKIGTESRLRSAPTLRREDVLEETDSEEGDCVGGSRGSKD